MSFWRRRVRRQCPPEVVRGLIDLLARYPGQARLIGDQLLYAEIGRDRASMTMESVATVERHCQAFEAVGL